ncbi:MAG: alpha/beta hydrolase [Rubellimicrobium sp.]|nr:alpha/beta hydrolase [Rubellimicrobium sp.]
MGRARWIVLAVAFCLAGVAVWMLEQDRRGLVIEPLLAGTTPATVFRPADGGDAPVVVIAHGFAGSRQLMESFALTLARAGYIAVSFDFQGHGRNPLPMSGDVNVIEGTTTVLMDETGRVSDAALALPGADGRLALVGHSMASDIVVRQAIRDGRVAALTAVSMFSLAVDAENPANMLIVAGEWERMLADEALKALRLADPEAGFGETVGDPALGTGRRAVIAPRVEHVAVLYSATTMREMLAWFDAAFGRESDGAAVVSRGGWIALLLVSVVALGWPLAGLARGMRAAGAPVELPRGAFLAATLGPALATPLVLWPLGVSFLPVLVADYLAVHFALQGVLALLLVARGGAFRLDAAALLLALVVAGFGIVLFGGVLDRYVASFFPTAERALIIAAMAAGAVPFMLADAFLTEGGRAALWRVLLVRGAALVSLGLAVALDFERLFFLVIILPVILLFFLLFGMAGGWVGRATWRPAAGGIGLGLFLAWALGVTFPLFGA